MTPMHPRNIATSRLARTCRTGALLLVLFGILGLLAHTVAVERRSGQTAGATRIEVR
jgi:hypothetical protein